MRAHLLLKTGFLAALVAVIAFCMVPSPSLSRGDPLPGAGGQQRVPSPAAIITQFDAFLDNVIASQLPSGELLYPAPPALRATFLAVQALQLLGHGGDVNVPAVASFVQACYNSSTHLFGDSVTNAFEGGSRGGGYSAIEATYYALGTLQLVGQFTPSAWATTATALASLQGAGGGFECAPGIATVHDAHFAYAALKMLGYAGAVAVDPLVVFLDGHQGSDPGNPLEYGGFRNVQPGLPSDHSFGSPNLVTAYYAVATLAEVGRLGSLNEVALCQFAWFCQNNPTNLYSYACANWAAENVGTAYVLALDPYLASDGSIDYNAAGSELLGRLNALNFNEGTRAPANFTLTAACMVVWGLSAGGRLGEVASGTRAALREFIASHRLLGGYAPVRTALLGDLAPLLRAVAQAGKLDHLNVNALYQHIRNLYSTTVKYFQAGGNASLRWDFPASVFPTDPRGVQPNGLAATLPALQVLDRMGRLNDFLGEIGGAAVLLGEVNKSQYNNESHPACDGAFCPQPFFASAAQKDPGKYLPLISPQWTVAALEIIGLLDKATPLARFNATSAWEYLSQFYAVAGDYAYFTRPAFLAVSEPEWTCRVAAALAGAGMTSYFDLAKVRAYLAISIEGASLSSVASHLRFLAVAGGVRGAYNASALLSLQASLVSSDLHWYRAQGGTLPDSRAVADLATLRGDRQLYFTAAEVPAGVLIGHQFAVAVTCSGLFSAREPEAAAVAFALLGVSHSLTPDAGFYRVDLHLADQSLAGALPWSLSATKLGWAAPAPLSGSLVVLGAVLAEVTCAGRPAADMTISARKFAVAVTFTTNASGGFPEGMSFAPRLFLAQGGAVAFNETLLANASATTPASRVYYREVSLAANGVYHANVTWGNSLAASFTITVDPNAPDSGEIPAGGDLAAFFAALPALSGGGAIGALMAASGVVSKRRATRKARPPA